MEGNCETQEEIETWQVAAERKTLCVEEEEEERKVAAFVVIMMASGEG